MAGWLLTAAADDRGLLEHITQDPNPRGDVDQVAVVVLVDRSEECLELGSVLLLFSEVYDVYRDLVLLELFPELD